MFFKEQPQSASGPLPTVCQKLFKIEKVIGWWLATRIDVISWLIERGRNFSLFLFYFSIGIFSLGDKSGTVLSYDWLYAGGELF